MPGQVLVIIMTKSFDGVRSEFILRTVVIVKKCLAIGRWIDVKFAIWNVSCGRSSIDSVGIASPLDIDRLIRHELISLSASFETGLPRLLLSWLQRVESVSASDDSSMIGVIHCDLYLSVVIAADWLHSLSSVHLVLCLLSSSCSGLSLLVLTPRSSIYFRNFHQTWGDWNDLIPMGHGASISGKIILPLLLHQLLLLPLQVFSTSVVVHRSWW